MKRGMAFILALCLAVLPLNGNVYAAESEQAEMGGAEDNFLQEESIVVEESSAMEEESSVIEEITFEAEETKECEQESVLIIENEKVVETETEQAMELGEMISIASSSSVNTAVQNKILSFQSVYPEGYCWDETFAGGKQCYGFALLMANNVFGTYPSGVRSASNGTVSNGWTCYTVTSSNCNSLTVEPGDLIDAGTSSSGAHHTAMVLSVTDTRITCVQCNMGSNCLVYWTSCFNYNSANATLSGIVNRFSSYGTIRLWKPSEELKNSIGNEPQGMVDSISAGVGYIDVTGWAFDKDNPEASISIHVYADDGATSEYMGEIVANEYRPDVGNAFPGVGDYHGFTQRIYTNRTGDQLIHVYALNVGSGSDNPKIGMQFVNITADTTKPIVENAYISQFDANGYTVVAKVSDNVAIDKVEFATWHEGQTTSDVNWYRGSLNADGTYSYRINVSDYENREGTYFTDVYAWDYAGNAGVQGFTQYIDRTAPVISGVSISNVNGSGFTVNCTVTDNIEVEKVQFPAWTEYNSGDDLLSDWGINSAASGTRNGNQFSFRVKDSDHNYERGVYNIHIYAYDSYGNYSVHPLKYDFNNLGEYVAETTYLGHIYQIIDDKVTWSEAKQICENAGGHLVTITSAEEQNAIMSIMPSNSTCGTYFIGGYTETGVSKWITEQEEFGYTNWYPGEPNNYGGVQGYYEINRTTGLWDDIGDSKADIGYICEFEPQNILPDDTPEESVPEGLWIAGVDENGYTYTGKAIKPEVRVYDHNTRLEQGKDYTISYKNNIKVNDASVEETAPTIVIKGKGNYKSKETVTFKILPKNIADSDITANDIVLKVNNKTQKPVPVVKRDGKKLQNKTDFTVEYVELAAGEDGANKEAGTYTVLIKGKGGYIGERAVTLTITENKLMSKTTVSNIKDQNYTGSAIKPSFTVKSGKSTLVEGTDYTVTYQNNIAVGTATIILKGKGDYSGEKKITFKIKGTAISKATVTGITDFVEYTGEAITTASASWGAKPVLKVKVNGEEKTLKEGTDYTISYLKNVNKGTATILFKGMNGYSGTLKKNFVIKAYDIATDSCFILSTSVASKVAYEKGGSKPKPTVTFNGNVLKEGTDYTLSYKNNTKINDGSNLDKKPTVVIKGKGNFSGSISHTYTITTQTFSGLTISAPDKVYKNQKNAYKSTPKITDLNGRVLKAGTDYEKGFTYFYKNATTLSDGTVRSAGSEVGANDIVPAGTVLIVRVQGKGNYSTDYLQGEYRIVKSNINKATVKVAAQTYTGYEIEPGKDDITVKLDKVKLSASDYEIVSYSNNIKKGKAKVTIKGVGNYGGTKTVTFTIKSKGFLWWWR